MTLLCTDVEGSTARWEKYGRMFGDALQIHDRLMRESLARHRGCEVKTLGDAFMVVFTDPLAALRCAVDFQAALVGANLAYPLLSQVDGICVRIGIHTGELAFRGEDYFGPAVHRASRICDAGHGQMILVSQETARAVSGRLPSEFRLEDQGLHRLKDLGAPERLYLLRHPRLPEPPARPLRTLEAMPHNFPAIVTSFVGRRREVAELMELLRTGHHRLITLTGAAGTGKTRLAMQVAADRLQDFPGGVWFVELSSVRDHAAAVTAIALALRLRLTAESDPRRQIIDFLRPRRCLLVLDNFEQVARAAPLISDLLRECPNLTCLVTSRQLLNLPAEQEYVVEPLSVPPPDKRDNHWDQYESLQLFAERCRILLPDFELTPEIAPTIGEICRRLDGVPLAIELAAARVGDMPPEQMLPRLTHRLDLLTAEEEVPQRHSTLRRAIDWSYELLTDDERALFVDLSVFEGGFFLEAAEAICQNPDTFDLVFSLRDKSLLKTDEVEGQTRYTMLETLREYARDKVDNGDAYRALRDRHAQFYLQLARQWSAKLDGAQSDAQTAVQVFIVDIHNMRAGMDWAAQQRDSSLTVEYAKALARFMLHYSLYDECDQRLALAEEVARQSNDRRALALLLLQRGRVAWRRSEYERARRLYTDSYEISRDLGDRARMPAPLINLGNIAWACSEYKEARRLYEEALALAIETKQPNYEGALRGDLGILACLQGEFEAAVAYFHDAIAMHRSTHNEVGLAFTLFNAADLFRRQKQYDRAQERLEESRRLFVALDYRLGLAMTGVQIGKNLLEWGRYAEARRHVEEGLRISREIGDRKWEMFALEVQARLAQAEGDLGRAYLLFRRSFEIACEVNDRKQLADVLHHYGVVLEQHGYIPEAFCLLTVAAGEYDARGLTADLADALAVRQRLSAVLPPDQIALLDQRAASIPPEAAFAQLSPAFWHTQHEQKVSRR